MGSLKLKDSADIDLEAQSFRNMVDFWAPELREILKGRDAWGIFQSPRRRRNLISYNILCKNKRRSGGKWDPHLYVSSEAETLLGAVS